MKSISYMCAYTNYQGQGYPPRFCLGAQINELIFVPTQTIPILDCELHRSPFPGGLLRRHL